jgi:hypothetical protein
MNSFELALEITKWVLNKDSLEEIEANERIGKFLESFEVVFKRIAVIEAKAQLSNCNCKIENLLKIPNQISKVESLSSEQKNILLEKAADILIRNTMFSNPSNGNDGEPSDKPPLE